MLGYSIADSTANGLEPTAPVLRRLRGMVDSEHVFMVSQRQQYFRKEGERKSWTDTYISKMHKRNAMRKIKQQFEEAWQQWLRTEGRLQGLTEPVQYHGPKLGHLMTPELDAASEPKDMMKELPSKQEMRTKDIYKKRFAHMLPSDILPGQWVDEGEENIFKIWKRPSHKQPFDIGKRGSNHVVRGNVF